MAILCYVRRTRLLFVLWAVAWPLNRLPAKEPAATAQLAALLDESWQFDLAEDPLFASYAGEHRYDHLLPDATQAAIARRAARRREFLNRLERIERTSLPTSEQVNYDIFRRLLGDQLESNRFQSHLMPITNRSGFHIEFPELPRETPLTTAAEYERYIARLAAFGRYADEHIELLRAGVKAGLTLPSAVLAGYQAPIDAQLVADPRQSLLYAPLKNFPQTVAAADRGRLETAAQQAIADSVVPGYRRFLEFMKSEYVPAARGSIACTALPQGRERYQFLVRHFTTLDVTPQAVHQTGLDEVARIDAEMRSAIERAKFQGGFVEFVEMLRTDPRFYAQTPEQLLKEVSLVLKRMDGQLPTLFATLPRMPYGVREVPAYIAPQTTTAYYMGPSGDGRRAGYFYVNTYNLKTRPLYEIEALSLHEAVPGHHLQIARQQELDNLPPMRRFHHWTAMVEGWGLYAERLGLEAGFYQDPYSDFGRLSYEMWRACRLVVDTCMHALGWSRQQAIDFMKEHTALTVHNITTEVDRYIAWPGQALAYKMGELKIRQLRAEAEQTLGAQFDVRQFHDTVLGAGSVPLDVLEANVRHYVQQAGGKTVSE